MTGVLACCGWVLLAHTYDVGPGQPFADPGEVPWESLQPGSLVRIHHRDQAYASKWVINTEATHEKPVVVQGIPDSNGVLPVISGDNAVTRLELNYWNEERSVIKVGGSNLPTDQEVPAYIRVENLDIRSARPAYSFTDESGAAAALPAHEVTRQYLSHRSSESRPDRGDLSIGALAVGQ